MVLLNLFCVTLEFQKFLPLENPIQTPFYLEQRIKKI